MPTNTTRSSASPTAPPSADAPGTASRDTRAVRRYLEKLAGSGTTRSDSSQLTARIEELKGAAKSAADPLERLGLVQRRLDLEARLTGDGARLTATVREGFVEAAARYSERRGISWSAWREVGVPASVLREAGVPRTRRRSQS